jgi:hypothetical protein
VIKLVNILKFKTCLNIKKCILFYATDVITLQSADSFEHVTRFLPEDGAVCAETCSIYLKNNIYFKLEV